LNIFIFLPAVSCRPFTPQGTGAWIGSTVIFGCLAVFSLNFEHKAGKVPDADYASLKSSLQDEAATLLAEISRLENSSAPQKGNRA